MATLDYLFFLNKLIVMKIFIVIFLTLFSLKAHSITFGGYSCGKVLQWERENDTTQIAMIKLYMAGFIHASNIHSTSNKIYFEDTDEETIFYLVIKECSKDPQQDLYNVAYRIWDLEIMK